MGGDQAVIVAGIGCRKNCPAAEIVALVRQAGRVDMLAAPAWKRDEPGLLEAAGLLGLPLRFVENTELAAAQSRCITRSTVVADAVGFASVAEAAALAHGAILLRARFGASWATCAIAQLPDPPLAQQPTPLLPTPPLPLPSSTGEGRGEGPGTGP